MLTLRKAAFILFALAGIPTGAAELWNKDRVLFEGLPERGVEDGATLTFKVIPQGKYRFGWCAVTYPDGTVGSLQDAEIKNGKATQKLKCDAPIRVDTHSASGGQQAPLHRADPGSQQCLPP